MIESSFDFLFHGLSKEVFLKDYFNQKVLLVKGNEKKFDEIFSLRVFNNILNTIPLEYPRARVTDHHNTIHKYDLIDDKDRYKNNLNNQLNPRKVMLAIAHGGTFVLDKIHLLHEPLEDFTDLLKSELKGDIRVNGYYTAANQMGVNVHFDRHDVLAIQIHGKKQWYYRNDDHMLSLPMRQQEIPSISDHESEWESVELEAGDVFYCPRGTWHYTRTNDNPSAHLAVGVYPLTLKEWLDRLYKEPEMAEILEQYICPLFHKEKATVNSNVINSLLDAITQAQNRSLSMNLKRRPYIELE